MMLSKENEENLKREVASVLCGYSNMPRWQSTKDALERRLARTFGDYGVNNLNLKVEFASDGYLFKPTTDNESEKAFLRRIFGV